MGFKLIISSQRVICWSSQLVGPFQPSHPPHRGLHQGREGRHHRSLEQAGPGRPSREPLQVLPTVRCLPFRKLASSWVLGWSTAELKLYLTPTSSVAAFAVWHWLAHHLAPVSLTQAFREWKLNKPSFPGPLIPSEIRWHRISCGLHTKPFSVGLNISTTGSIVSLISSTLQDWCSIVFWTNCTSPFSSGATGLAWQVPNGLLA